MNADNIITGIESFIKKQEDIEAKRQIDILPIRQKYDKEMEVWNKLSFDQHMQSNTYDYPSMPIELGKMSIDYMFTMSLKSLLKEIQGQEK